MAKTGLSIKYELISKNQTRMVTVVMITSVIIVLLVVFANSLFSKMTHQNKVIKAQEEALEVLRANKEELQKLEVSFQEFIESKQPATKLGKTNLDTVRDALPSVYNYPNLLVNINNLFSSRSISYNVTVGTINLGDQVTRVSPEPKPVEIPIGFLISGEIDDLADIFDRLDNSIRPINIRSMSVSYDTAIETDTPAITVRLEAVTYFLPKKDLKPTDEAIE